MGNQLIGKVVELFRRTGEVNQSKFDETVAVAEKRKISEEDSEARRRDFDNLFDSQLQTLRDRGCPPVILDMLMNQRSTVFSRVSEMTFQEGHISILPVIPTTYLTIYSQMLMVRNHGKEGYTYLESHKVSNVVETPLKPYYIFDVEDGEAIRGKSAHDAEKVIKKQGRHGLTEVELIALGVHTDVLSRHYVDAVGSCYGSDGVPGLWLNGGRYGRPVLNWHSRYGANWNWGATFCSR